MPYYVTFYSFKGGVGRTLALVNVAVDLVRRGRSVFIWELDLEAPGILSIPFFHPLRERAAGGTIDFLTGPVPEDLGEAVSRLVLEHPEFPAGRLRVLPAGVPDETYSRRFAAVHWEHFFGKGRTAGSELFQRLRRAVDSYHTDFVLIDARTGLTDVGAICTVQLADAVVLVYTLSHQSLAGTRQIQLALGDAERLRAVRDEPPRIFRAATMVPAEWPELAAQRRTAAQKSDPIARAGRRKRALQESYNLEPHVEIPFNSSLLLEERIWTHEFPDDPLSKAYRDLAAHIEEAAPTVRPREIGVAVGDRLGKRDEAEVVRRGKSFEDKVAEVLRLMGYEVERDVLVEGRQTDFLAHKREALQEIHFVGECKGGQSPLGVDEVAQLHTRLTSYRRQHPTAQGLLVSSTGFTAEAKAQAPSLGITLKTYEELLAGLIDLSEYTSWLIREYEGQDIERLYVEQDVWPERARQVLPLAGFIESWLADPQARHLTLLGDYGTGKTWFTRKLAYTLAKRCREDPVRNRQVIRIDLREVAKALSLDNLLFDHLQRFTRQPNPRAIRYLLAEGRLLLILDGFDEMAARSDWQTTLSDFRELAEAAQGEAKVLLTCRTHYFKEDAQIHEWVEGRRPDMTPEGTALYKEISGRTGFSVAFLRDFTEAQIGEYLQRACGERAAEVQQVIKSMPGLQDLAARPVLLDMIVKSAPRLLERGGAVKVAHLYEAYTEEWLARQDWRLRLTREGRTTLVQELAARLWETDTARIHYRALADVLAGLLKDRITTDRDLEMADYEVRTASFLTRDAAGNYGFSHRSFLEFFLAQRTARLLREEGGGAAEAFRLRLFSPQVIGFLRDLCEADKLSAAAAGVLEKPYARLCSENALRVYASLGETARRPARLELEGAQLAGFALGGLDLTGANLRQANLAAADLSRATLEGACLAGADLTEARLESAHCAGADFSGAVLGGADLSRARLTGAVLKAADLSFATLVEADLEGVEWSGAVVDGAGFLGAGPEWAPALEPARYAPGAPAAVPKALVQAQPAGSVRAVSYSRDGRLIAVASGGAIALFDTVTGRCRRVLSGYRGGVTSIAWNPDGRQLAGGSDDKTVRLWEVETGRLLRTLEGHQDVVRAVAWEPQGRQLASGSDDKTVRLWEPETGRLLRTFEGHHDWVRAVAWDPEGWQLASASDDKTVRLWEPESGRLLRTLEGHEGSVVAVAWEPRGRQLASGSADGTVRLWEPETGRLLRTLEGHERGVLAVAWDPRGRHLASGSWDITVRLWEPETGRLLRSLEGHHSWVWAVAWDPQGRQLASGSFDPTVRLWEPETGRLMRTLGGRHSRVGALACDPQGRQLASGSEDGTVRLWELETGRLMRTLEGHLGSVWALAWDPQGRQLASGSDDKTVRLWEPETGRLLRTLEGHQGSVRAVAWDPQGRQLASGSLDKTIRLWEPESGRLLRTLEGHQDWVRAVAWAPQGRQLVSASDDKTIRLWEPKTGRLRRTLEGHHSWVLVVAWDPQGRQLASASDDGTVRLWEPETGRLLRTLEGHHSWLWAVAWAPHGRQLASGSDDGTVRLWEPETGRLLRILEGHLGPVYGVIWLGKGRLASCSADGSIRIWDAGFGACLAVLYQFRGGGWLALAPDGHYIGNEAGKRRLTFVDNWAVYSAEVFPELEDPEAVRAALAFPE